VSTFVSSGKVSLGMIASAGSAQRAQTADTTHREVQRLAREAIPTLADFCLVYRLARRALRAIAAVHVTRAGSRNVRALMKAYRIRTDDRGSTVAQVVRTQRPLVRTEIRPDAARGRTNSVARLHLRLATRSALVVPIVRDGDVLGAVSLCYSRSDRSYSPRDIAAAELFARRVADALASEAGANGPRAIKRRPREGPTVRPRATP
jgi:GAF domain-containing protein